MKAQLDRMVYHSLHSREQLELLLHVKATKNKAKSNLPTDEVHV